MKGCGDAACSCATSVGLKGGAAATSGVQAAGCVGDAVACAGEVLTAGAARAVARGDTHSAGTGGSPRFFSTRRGRPPDGSGCSAGCTCAVPSSGRGGATAVGAGATALATAGMEAAATADAGAGRVGANGALRSLSVGL